ncbi:hypothetical protein IX329_000666 [Fusobacterium necrophorum]|nr:hypothetical protein [Fusobacterium necrophorum]MBR8733093.1 hypothetical protein [Fusobacterium necrophorum]MBR8789363.1 hypothetical protein [Fusobacterium necrophorum]
MTHKDSKSFFENFIQEDSAFHKYKISKSMEERLKIKDVLIEMIILGELKPFSELERNVWLLYRTGMSSEEIQNRLGISKSMYGVVKYRAGKKIENFAEKFKERSEKLCCKI